MKATYKGHVALLSLTLFLCPLFVFGLSRWVADEMWSVSFNDYFSLAFYWIAAGLVWARVKFAWLLALSLLTSAVLINAVSLFANLSSDLSPLYVVQFLLSVAAIVFVVWMVDFLNHKFLDRRDQFSILGPAHRYVVSEPAELNSSDKTQISGRIKSLSFSGALLETEAELKDLSSQKWRVNIPQFSYSDQPVDVTRVDAKHLRLKFLNVNPVIKWKMRRRLKGRVKE